MAGGLESVMANADPTSDMPALQQVRTNIGQAGSGLRADAALINPNDMMNQVIVGADRDAQDMLQYKQSMLQAQQAQQAQQAKYMEYLQGLKNPERENWDAIGRMGAAMAQPNTGMGNQFASGLTALQGATEDRNTKYDNIDKLVQQQYLDQANQLSVNASGNYKDAATAYQDKIKSIIDYNKAIKVAQGDPGSLAKTVGMLNHPDPTIRAIAEKAWAMEHGGPEAKLMATVNPQYKLGTPEYAKYAAQLRLKPEARLAAIQKFTTDNTDAYVQAYGPNAAAKLSLDAQNFVDGAVQSGISESKTTTGTPAEWQAINAEQKASQPTKDATATAIVNSELEAAKKQRDAAPVGSKRREELNQAVIAIQQDIASNKHLNAPVPLMSSAEKEAAKAKAQVVGEAQGKAEISLPSTLQNALDTVKLIEQLDAHPGKKAAVGFSSVVPSLPGGEAKGFELMLEQIQNKTFLDAFEKLKGAGAITDFEGKKATSAATRLSTALSEEDFQTALNELKEVVKAGERRAYEKAGKAAPEATPKPINKASIPAAAIARLKKNPAEAALFDEQFGAGASQSILGK